MGKRLQDYDTPFLVCHGTDDKVTAPAASQELYAKAASKDKKILMYEGCWHALLSEPDGWAEKASVMTHVHWFMGIVLLAVTGLDSFFLAVFLLTGGGRLLPVAGRAPLKERSRQITCNSVIIHTNKLNASHCRKNSSVSSFGGLCTFCSFCRIIVSIRGPTEAS